MVATLSFGWLTKIPIRVSKIRITIFFRFFTLKLVWDWLSRLVLYDRRRFSSEFRNPFFDFLFWTWFFVFLSWNLCPRHYVAEFWLIVDSDPSFGNPFCDFFPICFLTFLWERLCRLFFNCCRFWFGFRNLFFVLNDFLSWSYFRATVSLSFDWLSILIVFPNLRF